MVLPVQCPSLNSRRERVIQRIKQECSNYFLVLGEEQLIYFFHEYVLYYNNLRAFSACGYLPPSCDDLPPENNAIVLDDIVRRERLGELIQCYQRAM